MKQVTVAVLVVLAVLSLVAPALADGGLQWGTCADPVAVITDANHGGAPVPVGDLVELWDANGTAPLAIAHIGQGYLTPLPGRVVTNSSLVEGSYVLQLRVYDLADPYQPGVESCVAIVGLGGLGTGGIPVQISTLSPQTVCFPSAEIPAQSYNPTQGGCQVMSPMAVTLASFDATAMPHGVLLSWQTVSEVDNAGFNLHRGLGSGGPWTQVNASLIPSQGPGSSQGFSYEFLDETVTAGATYYYLLESVNLAGGATQYGPIEVFYGGGPTAVGLNSLAAQPIGTVSGVPVALLALVSLGLAGFALRRR